MSATRGVAYCPVDGTRLWVARARHLCGFAARRYLPATPAAHLPCPAQGIAATPARVPPAAAGPSNSSFVTEEEQRALSASQLAFLERKRRAAAGLGPIMPDSCTCAHCGGSGTAVCHQCKGSGMNSKDMAEVLFQNEMGVVIQASCCGLGACDGSCYQHGQ